ncbi:DUF4760 domain-containing protein [Roseibium sediminis]|uniref:DUF4760 domain-containing protein n=1 Tax=Roseibium sediminis TaxID=1775174 RepID=UPI00123D8431|nr:hypothetical protein [Roseibium sediminis]
MLITAFQQNSELAESDFYMAKKISRSELVIEASLSDDEDRLVMRILDYYEVIATASRQRYLDPHVVANLRGGAMCAAYDICKTYIQIRREKTGVRIYSNFEWFYNLNRRRLAD